MEESYPIRWILFLRALSLRFLSLWRAFWGSGVPILALGIYFVFLDGILGFFLPRALRAALSPWGSDFGP